MAISYGRLAMELTTSTVAQRDARSILSWLEDSELIHIDELHWLEFVNRFNLSVDLEPATLVDSETEAAIRAAAAQDPGAEADPSVHEALEDLTAAAMDEIYKETLQAIKAALNIGQPSGLQLLSQAGAEGLTDAIMGRIAKHLRAVARDAYGMDR